MALYLNIYKPTILRSLSLSYNKIINKYLLSSDVNQALTLDEGAVDEFTTQLMHKKWNKWETKRIKRKSNSSQEFQYKTQVNETKINIHLLDVSELDILIKDTLESNNVTYLQDIIVECLALKRLPTLIILLKVFAFYSQCGDKETLLKLIELYNKTHPITSKENSEFMHYIAEAVWVKGNVTEALLIFEDIYRSNLYLRRRIKLMLRHLIADSISKQSEVVLVLIINFSKRLAKDYKDYYFLANIWQMCFLSEWFTDQCIALDLLKENEGLCKILLNQIPVVVAVALRNHKTEIVHKLLEVLLNYKHLYQSGQILESLFDYRRKYYYST